MNKVEVKEQLKNCLSKVRRKGLKVLALCERARVKTIHVVGRVAEAAEKPRRAIARHPVSPLLYMVILALTISAVTFNGMYTRAYVLSVDGVEVGVVADQEELDAVVAQVEVRASSVLGEDYRYDADLELTPALVSASNGLSDMGKVEDAMFASAGALCEAWAISVDGVELGYAPTEADMNALLERVAAPYITDDTIRFEFVEKVQTFPVELPANTQFKVEELYQTLAANVSDDVYYTVCKGDTLNGIAEVFEITTAELQDLNPDLENPNKLSVGQELLIRPAVPYLSVRIFTKEDYEAAIPSPVEYIDTDTLYVGDTSVKEEGSSGVAWVIADAVYVNGVETQREVLDSQVVVAPTTTYVYRGTAPRPATASKGYYQWPVYGPITSSYGWRTLSGRSDFHQGIDIGCSYGTPIKAADGGVVTYAGWRGSYGKLVVITHDNGSKTYYAHNSALLVSEGDRVFQGQVISKAGLTGSTTGCHLHFEIRLDGKHTVNPRNYLP